MIRALFCPLLLALMLMPLFTASVFADLPARFEGQFIEGGLVRGQTAPGARVEIDGVAVPVSASGGFVLGLHRDRDEPVTIAITVPGAATATRSFAIAQRTYNVQRIDGLPDRMVTPRSEETLRRIRAELAAKKAARPLATAATDYEAGFIWPARGRISGVYGSQRILNGEPRRPHYGVDIAAPTGTPVKAPAAGIVTLADPDMYFEGGLIFIDHGHGVIGVLMHLDTIAVNPGDRVAQGDVVGTVGATGRATGPHLDWRMYWRDARIDPTLLVPPMEAP
ncbi:MAG: M23 family metallopeptidase [Alphaproteobacteria bacterium]